MRNQPTPQTLATRTLGNATWNVVPLGWAFVIGMAAIPFVVNRIGVADFGLFGIFSLLLVPASLASMGFGEATIKFASAHIYRGELATAARYVRTTLAMNLVVGVIGAVVIWLLGPAMILAWFNVPAGDETKIRDCCQLMAAVWLFNQVSAVFMGVPVAFQDFRRVAFVQIIISTVTTALGVGFVWVGWGLWGYSLASALGSLTAMVAWYLCGRALFTGISLYPALYRDVWGTSFRFGGWQAVAQIGALLANQSERFLLGVFLNATSLGFYNIALNLEQKAYVVVFKLSEVLFPMFSALSSETAEAKADKLIRTTWLLTLLAASILVPLVPFAQPLLSLWINPEIGAQAYSILQYLAIGGTLGCVSNASYFFLLGNGHSRVIAELTFATGATTVGAALWLLPAYGFAAAALPGIASMIVQQVVLYRVLRRSILANRLSRVSFFCAAQLPVFVSIAVCLTGLRLGIQHLSTTWPKLVGGYLLLSLTCGIVIILLTGITAYGRLHWLDLMRLSQIAQSYLPQVRWMRGT